MEKLKSLTQSSRYTDFIQSRDHALEEILTKYLRANSNVLDFLKLRAHEVASHLSVYLGTHYQAKRARDEFERRMHPWFDMAIRQSTHLMTNLRKTTYTLSYAGQAEGLGRALGVNTRLDLTKEDLKEKLSDESPSGGSLHQRVELAYHRLLRDLVDAYQLSQVLESPIEETLARLDRAFPKVKVVKKQKAPMAKMKEAKKKKPDEEIEEENSGSFVMEETIDGSEVFVGASRGFIDPADWEEAVQDYKSEYLPFSRGPNDKVFGTSISETGDEEKVEIYQWELEQEVTEDFVQSVRDGELDAAKENGVTDMQWIAIIDAKTDECCSERDGLTTAEIQSKLNDGESMGDCDSVAPPAHQRCRCRLSPMTDNLPEESPPDFGGFDSWLTERANAT